MKQRLALALQPSVVERALKYAVIVGTVLNLPLRKRVSIRRHVSMCGFCRRYEKQLNLLREGVGHYADPDANVVEKSPSPAAKEKLEKALADRAK